MRTTDDLRKIYKYIQIRLSWNVAHLIRLPFKTVFFLPFACCCALAKDLANTRLAERFARLSLLTLTLLAAFIYISLDPSAFLDDSLATFAISGHSLAIYACLSWRFARFSRLIWYFAKAYLLSFSLATLTNLGNSLAFMYFKASKHFFEVPFLYSRKKLKLNIIGNSHNLSRLSCLS